MSTPENERLIDLYVQTLQTMTSLQMAHRLGQFTAKDVTYRDPRMSGQGPDAIKDALASLFDGTEGIVWRVTDRAWGQDGHTVYLRWDRLLKLPGERKHAYSGISEIMIGMNGKITSIIDHWDPQDHVVRPQLSLLHRLLRRA